MEKRENASDEIDIKELFLNGVLIVKRNFLQFLISFIVGITLGFVYGMLVTKVYESKMIISSDILNKIYATEFGENLDDIIEDENTDLLAEKLGMSLEEVKKVKSIELLPIDNNKEATSFISVVVEVTDLKILPKLQSGITNYIENNEFVKVRIEQRKNTLRQLITKTDEEILSLEKFKKDLYNGDFLKENKGSMMFDPTTVNTKVIQLTSEKINYQNSLALANSVQVVEGFTEFLKAKKPNKLISLTAGATLGLLFVILLIAFKSVRALVEIAEKNRTA